MARSGAVIVHHRGRGLTRAVLPAVFAKRFLYRVFGLTLQIDVEAGAHDEDALLHRLRQLVDELLHLVISIVEIIIRLPFVAAVDRHGRIAAGAEHLAFRHHSGFDQIVEHGVGAGAGGRQIDMRRIAWSAP